MNEQPNPGTGPATAAASADECPRCAGREIKKRSTGKSVQGAFIFLFVTGALNIAVYKNPAWDSTGGLGFVLGLTLIFAATTVPAAGFSAWLGKNRCKSCSHRWR